MIDCLVWCFHCFVVYSERLTFCQIRMVFVDVKQQVFRSFFVDKVIGIYIKNIVCVVWNFIKQSIERFGYAAVLLCESVQARSFRKMFLSRREKVFGRRFSFFVPEREI